MSVLENIAMGKEIPKEQIEDVCPKLNIYDEILSLPKGFDTLLGEKGQICLLDKCKEHWQEPFF